MNAMSRLFLALFFATACGGQVEGGQDGGGGGGTSAPSCTTKTCPNDPELTQAQIQSCQTSRARFDNCASVCGTYNACVNQHIKEECGADGKVDTMKAIEVTTVTCKPPGDCVTCVSK